MEYGDTYYLGRSSKAMPMILGVGFALGALVAWRAAATIGRASADDRKLRFGLQVLTVGLASGAVMYGSGKGRLIGATQEVPAAAVQRFVDLQVPARELAGVAA